MTAPATTSSSGTVAVRLRDFARTTRIGRLATATALTLALVLLSGVLAMVAVLRANGAADDVVNRAGPLAAASQELYRALSDADATAAQGFLSGAAEPPELRVRYQGDITAAGAALAAVTNGAVATGRSDDPTTVLATGLPVYTGLVETARTNDRQGRSVGAAYLREASTYAQTTLLPAARTIYDQQSVELDDAQDVADGGVWVVLALLAVVAALVSVVLLHRQVARTTKRRLTPGLIVAGASLAFLLLWGTLALGAATLFTDSARDDGSAPNRAAVASRFAVLQSRSDDMLTLVARGAGSQYEQEYTRRSIEFLGFDGHLDQAQREANDRVTTDALAEARTAAYSSVVGHTRGGSLDASGNYDQAVALALSTAPDGGTTAVVRTEDALRQAIGTTAQTAADDAATAADATILLALGVVVLVVAAGVGVVVGLWPRFQEYR